MNLAIVSSELHFRRGICLSSDYEKLEICRRRRRISATIARPISCFASHSSSSPAKEVGSAAASNSLKIRRPEKLTSSCSSSCDFVDFEPPSSVSPSRDLADFKPPSSASSSCDLANFKPPPPAAPPSPKDLARELPFQYWYSYADLPPGIPKRKPKNSGHSAPESNGRKDGLNGRRTGGSGSLWEAVLAVGAESEFDVPKVVRRKRGGGGGGGDFREAKNGNSSTDHERGFRGASSRASQEDGNAHQMEKDEKKMMGDGDVMEPENGNLTTDHERRFSGASSCASEDENAPLTEDDKKSMILSCHGTSRQVNIGWEGWNENYFALIHSYWKRSKVCKIKCKGAMTLDMDSLCNMLEAETGGTVIGRVGGTVYLFRGRNYKYWRKPGQPIIRYKRPEIRFPKRLPIPSKLTKDDFNVLRARGRVLPALCKPGKHGVYLTLLDDIRKAFETQDLVRVNCQEFYSRNMKILGSQLQALVPCELISFEFEHILMWRSKDGNSPKDEVVLEHPEESSPLSNALS